MDDVPQNAMLFFEQHPESYPLYEAFYEKLMSRFPEARAKVQKSQISFYNRHLFACVSFLRVKKKADLPDAISFSRWDFRNRWILTAWQRKQNPIRAAGQHIS